MKQTVNSILGDSPSWLWEAPKHEELFERFEKYLEIRARIGELNESIDMLHKFVSDTWARIHEQKVRLSRLSVGVPEALLRHVVLCITNECVVVVVFS